MNHYISSKYAVYITIQSGHLNFFESISVTHHTEMMYAFVSDVILVP